MYNLTDNQKTLLRWLVQEVRAGRLPNEEIVIYWIYDQDPPQSGISNYHGDDEALEQAPEITIGALDALVADNLILCDATLATKKSGSHYERKWRCTLQGRAYEAVDTEFNAPDTSFVKYLTPLGGIVGVFRNPCAHRLIDPSPEEGGAVIVFVNLLIKKLEILR